MGMRRICALLLMSASCFSPRFEECAILCEGKCPGDWECASDGYCHASADEPSCTADLEIDATPVDEADGALPPPPDANGCTAVSVLANGAFDESVGNSFDKDVPGWTSNPRPVGTVVMHDDEVAENAPSPSYHAWAAGPLDQTNDLCTDVTLPAGTTGIDVGFVLHITTQETTTTQVFDELVVLADGTELARYSNLDDDDAYAAQHLPHVVGGPSEVTLCFRGSNDAAFQTLIHVDDVVVIATVCQ
jgi:hypothetical protein